MLVHGEYMVLKIIVLLVINNRILFDLFDSLECVIHIANSGVEAELQHGL